MSSAAATDTPIRRFIETPFLCVASKTAPIARSLPRIAGYGAAQGTLAHPNPPHEIHVERVSFR